MTETGFEILEGKWPMPVSDRGWSENVNMTSH